MKALTAEHVRWEAVLAEVDESRMTEPAIDACFEKATALGGGVAVPKTTIPGMGSFGFVHAPDGNLIGLHERGQ